MRNIKKFGLQDHLLEARQDAFYICEDKLIDLIRAGDRDAIELVYRINARWVNELQAIASANHLDHAEIIRRLEADPRTSYHNNDKPPAPPTEKQLAKMRQDLAARVRRGAGKS